MARAGSQTLAAGVTEIFLPADGGCTAILVGTDADCSVQVKELHGADGSWMPLAADNAYTFRSGHGKLTSVKIAVASGTPTVYWGVVADTTRDDER